MKTNNIDKKSLGDIQDKINAASLQNNSTLFLSIVGQFLLGSIALNDIFGNGIKPKDEYQSIRNDLENNFYKDGIKK